MSDTQSKIDQRRKEARKRQAQNRKKENAKIKYKTKQRIKVSAVIVVAVLLVAALILPQMAITKRWLTAVTIGDTKISTAEYSYYYQMSFSNYYQTMVSYVGAENVPINLNRSLKSQDMSEDQTYADYFSDNAVTQLTQMVVLASEAEKNGYALPEEEQEKITTLVEQVQQAADNEGEKVDAYLAKHYGAGFNLEIFKKCVERELLAQSYQEYKTNEPEYTTEQLNAYYQEHQNDFTTATYRIENFKAVDPSEESLGVTAEEAKENAQKFLDKITDEDSFAQAALKKAQEEAAEGVEAKDSSLMTGMTYSSTNYIDSNVANWVFSDSAKAGEKTLIESADGKTFYVVYMVEPMKRTETKTVNVRHILVSVSDMQDEEAKKAGKEQAEALLKQWKENGATEEAFAQLASEQTADTASQADGGLYERVMPGQMVTNFDAWCFDATRKAGDTDIVETDYGYHVMYFIGSDVPVWQARVESAMRSADYTAFYESASANYEVSTSWLGMHFRNEPI